MISNETLVQRIRSGNSVPEDMQALYENNLPLIRKFIKPYAAYEPMEDLLQESYFGLLEAVQRYETDRNVRFMTFAQYYILLAVRKYVEKCSSIVRIPSHTRQKIARYKKTVQKLEQEQGQEPTAAELAAFMRMTIEEVHEIQALMKGVSSLDSPLSDDNSLTLADTLQADFNLENDVIDKIYTEHSENELWGIVARYTAEKENEVIKEYFINNKNMAQIARESGLSIHRIREIKEKGLRRLRIGKAKRELLQKFDVVESRLYRGTLANFREHDSSIVEYLAIQKLGALERYQRHLAEIEEMRRKRISFTIESDP